MKNEQRERKLLEMLTAKDSLSISEIAQGFQVSLPTARRLCRQLAEKGKARRFRGGINIRLPNKAVYSFDSLRSEHLEEKNRIACYASSLVKSNQVLFLEAGTTLQQFSIALADRIRKQEVANLSSIFTNSMANLETLHPVQNNIQMIGGQYREERKDFTGYLSELALRGLQFDYCFLGADAITITGGVMAMDMDTVRFDAALVNHAEKVVIMAHSEKFYKSSLISYMDVFRVDYLITDSALERDTANKFHEAHVNLILV